MICIFSVIALTNKVMETCVFRGNDNAEWYKRAAVAVLTNSEQNNHPRNFNHEKIFGPTLEEFFWGRIEPSSLEIKGAVLILLIQAGEGTLL